MWSFKISTNGASGEQHGDLVGPTMGVSPKFYYDKGMGQNPIPLVNIKIAGKWMFIPLKMVCIGIDP